MDSFIFPFGGNHVDVEDAVLCESLWQRCRTVLGLLTVLPRELSSHRMSV